MTLLDPLPKSTERVTLRRLRPDDLSAFQAYRLDPVVGQYQGWSATSDNTARGFLNEMRASEAFVPGKWFQIGIADRYTDVLLGDIGVCVSVEGTEAEIGFTLGRLSQGKGLAAEAVKCALGVLFASTRIQRTIAITDSRNDAAHKLLASIGMERVRTVDTTFRDMPCVEHTFSMRRPSGA